MKIAPISLFLCVSLFMTACVSHTTQNGADISGSKKNLTAANYNVQLGVGYLQQGLTQRAKSKLLLALEQAPDWAPAQDAMAYFHEMTGEPKLAEQFYLKAIQLEPNAGAVHNNYGAYLCRMGRRQQAEQQFLTAINDPQYVDTAEAYENAGLCAMGIPDNKKAEMYFAKALQQDPLRATSLLELASISYKKGNYPQAKNYLTQYMQVASEKADPQALSLGIEVGQKLHDKQTVEQYKNQLNQSFPDINPKTVNANAQAVS